jgi:hypothetical protein
MVRLAKKLSRATGPLLLVPILLNAGCVGLDKNWPASIWSEPTPARIEAAWLKHVEQITDTQNGAPTPAVTGVLYLFANNARGKPMIGSGKVVIDLYDDGATPGGQPKHREEMIFPSEVLATQKTVNQVGVGYTLAIPCPPDAKNVHLTVRFEPEGGGAPLMCSSATFALDRGPTPFLPTATSGTAILK